MKNFKSDNPAKLLYDIEMHTRNIEEKYHQMMWQTIGEPNLIMRHLNEKFVVFEIPSFDFKIYPGYYAETLKNYLKKEYQGSFFGQLGPNMTITFFNKVDTVVDDIFNPKKWEQIQQDYENDLEQFSVLIAEKYYSLQHISDFMDKLDKIIMESKKEEDPSQ